MKAGEYGLLYIFFLIILLLSYIKNKSKFSWITIFTFVMIGIGLQFFAANISRFVRLFISTTKDQQKMIAEGFDSNFLYSIISTGVIAPIIEEYIFRGGIQKKLMAKFDIRIALILQSLIFGIFHFNLYQLFPTIIIGLIFGYYYYKFKSLYAPIILHISLNTYAVIGMSLPQRYDNMAWHFTAISLVIGLFLSYSPLIKNIYSSNQSPDIPT